VITPVEQENQNPRKGWSEAFKQMHELGEDKLYFPDNNYDFEWEW
jgi:hypothetical protein